MPNPIAARLIADNLHELTTDDGTTLRNAQLTPSKAMPQTWHDDLAKHRLGQGQGIVNLIEAAGGSITMPGDGPAPPEPAPNWVEIHCRACMNVLLKINLIQPDVGHARYLIDAMSALDPECPHHPEAERQ